MILRDRDGTWRCRGWPYEIVGRFVKDLGQRDDGFPVNYCSLIRSFRDHLKAAPKADPAQLLLRINRRLATNEWERESVEKAAALHGASVEDDVVTVPFSAEHDYLLAHQPRDATTWFVLNEADLFPAIAWDRRAMVI